MFSQTETRRVTWSQNNTVLAPQLKPFPVPSRFFKQGQVFIFSQGENRFYCVSNCAGALGNDCQNALVLSSSCVSAGFGPNPHRPHSHWTRDATRTQIGMFFLWCCLRAVWTLPFTSIGSISFARRHASCVDWALTPPPN